MNAENIKSRMSLTCRFFLHMLPLTDLILMMGNTPRHDDPSTHMILLTRRKHGSGHKRQQISLLVRIKRRDGGDGLNHVWLRGNVWIEIQENEWTGHPKHVRLLHGHTNHGLGAIRYMIHRPTIQLEVGGSSANLESMFSRSRTWRRKSLGSQPALLLLTY